MSLTKTASEIWRAFQTDGQPASGIHNPVKADIRRWGREMEARLFDDAADAQAATVDTNVQVIVTAGRAAPGDRGGATYVKVGSEPSHGAKLQTADGAWWEVADFAITPEMCGAVGDTVTSDTAAFESAFNARGRLLLGASRYAIASTINTPTSSPLGGGEIIGVGGSIASIQDGFFRNPVNISGLVWTGANGGTILKLDEASGLKLAGFGIAGRKVAGSGNRAAIGILIPGNAPNGTGNNVLERINFRDLGIGVQCGENSGDGNAADMTYVNCGFNSCDTGVVTKNTQSVNHRFDVLHANNCTRVVTMERGGNLHADMVQLGACGGGGADDWCFDFRTIDDATFASRISGLRYEANTQKIARITQNGMLVIDGFTEAQGDQNARMFSVNGGTLVLRNGRMVTHDPTTRPIHVFADSADSVLRFENVYFETPGAFNISDWIEFETTAFHRVKVIFKGCTYGPNRRPLPDMANSIEEGPVVLRRVTTDATANVPLTFDGAAPARSNTVFLQADTLWGVEATVVGWDATGAVAFTGRRAATIRNNPANTSTQLNVQTIGTDYNPGSFGGCTIDRGNDQGWPTVEVRVTGKAATTINWKARITGVAFGASW